jgi:hypothetical protein
MRHFDKGPFASFEYEVEMAPIVRLAASADGKVALLLTTRDVILIDAFTGEMVGGG